MLFSATMPYLFINRKPLLDERSIAICSFRSAFAKTLLEFDTR